MHFQSGCCSGPTVSSSGLNLRTKLGFALFTAIRFDVYKKTLFSLCEVVALYQRISTAIKDRPITVAPCTILKGKRKKSSKRKRNERTAHGSSKTGSCATGASAYEVGIPSLHNLLRAGGRSGTRMRNQWGTLAFLHRFRADRISHI